MARGALRLDCLGSGHAYSHGAYWSGFLVNGRVLLDCPPQALAHLYRLGERTLVDLDLVLLSHMHSDHVFGMDLLLLELRDGRASEGRGGRPLAVAAPPGGYDRLREIVGESSRLRPRGDARLEWFEQTAPFSFAWAGVEVDALEVEHHPALISHGYRLRIDGRVLAYSGDTKPCPAVEALAEGAEVFILECGGGGIHYTWDDVLELRARLPSETEVLVTHYDHLDVPDLASVRGLTLSEDFGVYEY